MGYKMLVVDHDILIREKLISYLRNFYEVVSASDSKTALCLFHSQQIDIILLENELIELDGFDLIRQIRRISQIPIVVLSNRSTIEEQIKGYDLGVDDYIVKPYDLNILLAKIRRLLTRVYNDKGTDKALAFDRLVVNKLARTVRIDNKLINFRPKEFDLLVFLIENEGVVLDRDRILDTVWGIDYFGDTRVVDSHIKKVRKKLGIYSKSIHTIFGIGYKFELYEKL